MAEGSPPPNHWQDFYQTLKARVDEPRRHPTFVMYFFGIIVLVGGFGIIEPLVSYGILGTMSDIELPKALISATYTYFVAIAATAAVDLILSYHQRKYFLMFFLVCSLLVFMCALFAAMLGTVLNNAGAAIFPSVIGYFAALFLWWVGNSTNVHLLDTPIQNTAPTGGDPQDRPSGDLTGFKA
jgi:hypothetical protein